LLGQKVSRSDKAWSNRHDLEAPWRAAGEKDTEDPGLSSSLQEQSAEELAGAVADDPIPPQADPHPP
jgi:hypothetical protein